MSAPGLCDSPDDVLQLIFKYLRLGCLITGVYNGDAIIGSNRVPNALELSSLACTCHEMHELLRAEIHATLRRCESQLAERAFKNQSLESRWHECVLPQVKLHNFGCAVLARLVQGGSAPHLTRLELVNNQIGDDGAKHLFGALSTAGVAPKLRLLALSYNHVGDKAMPALAAALVVHPSLETLHLQRNRIADGLVDVASALLRHRKSGACGKLRTLVAHHNMLTDLSFFAMASLLRADKCTSLPSLRCLDLSANRASHAGQQAVADACLDGNNRTLLLWYLFCGIPVWPAGRVRVRTANGGALFCRARRQITVLRLDTPELCMAPVPVKDREAAGPPRHYRFQTQRTTLSESRIC